MSYKLCCGALNVSQLTIPALPTSEIERIGNDDSSTADTESLTDQLNYEDEPSGVSTTVCEDEITDTDLHNVPEQKQENDAIAAVSEVSTTSKPVVRKKIKSATVGHKKGEKSKDLSKKKNKFFAWKRKKRFPAQALRVEERNSSLPENNQTKNCVCTGFKKTDESLFDTASVACASCSVVESLPSSGRTSPQQASVSRITMGAGPSPSSLSAELRRMVPPPPRAHTSAAFAAVLAARGPVGTGGEMDDDQARIAQRIRDIELGIEINRGHSAYPHFQYPSARNSLSASSSSTNSDSLWSLTCSFQNQCAVSVPRYPVSDNQQSGLTTFGHGGRVPELGAGPSQPLLSVPPPGPCIPRTEYTQVDYIHCLVPDLARIANCSFYWGVMDRYEAERLLENRAEGTFLLRDSAQDDFLFSVSFRRYGRSLHARIDQWNHKFSFDTHDPGVFAATTVTGLIEHYKDPNCCMFFEPMLTIPLARNFPFSLQHLCRSEICGKTTYDGLSYLPLPKSLVQYLKYYHYKQKVRVRHMQVFN